MSTDQLDKVAVLADNYDLRPMRGIKYLEVGCVSQAKIAQG